METGGDLFGGLEILAPGPRMDVFTGRLAQREFAAGLRGGLTQEFGNRGGSHDFTVAEATRSPASSATRSCMISFRRPRSCRVMPAVEIGSPMLTSTLAGRSRRECMGSTLRMLTSPTGTTGTPALIA